jgi:probable phosphoglycerate mutase
VLVVGHAGVNWAILCHVLGVPLEHLFRVCQDYGCLIITDCGPSGHRLKALNVTLDDRLAPGDGATDGDRRMTPRSGVPSITAPARASAVAERG